MQHHFDVELAQRYGLTEAILLNHFSYWIELNQANGKNFFDGRYWTFCSVKAFSEIFPYLAPKKIRVALAHLQEAGLLVTGNFNRSAYDRTLWYAFSDLGISILPKGQMEIPEKANQNCPKGEPIPDNKTDNNPDNETDIERGKRKRFTPPTLDEVAAYCNEIHSSISPAAFIDYYKARGWKYGAGKPMVDWKAAVRNWERLDKARSQEAKQEKTAAQAYHEIFAGMTGGGIG